VHGAELKAQVIAACREPGASVAAVALAHGLNANLVRKWLVGRGLKRAGLARPSVLPAATARSQAVPVAESAPLQFLPIDLPGDVHAAHTPVAAAPTPATGVEPPIHIEVSRGGLRVQVRWPATQAGHCVSLLRELLAQPR
jgi:transposase